MAKEQPDFRLSPGTLGHVRAAWRQVEPLADVFALTLYRRLFERAPHLRDLFYSGIETQGRRVFETFTQTVALADTPSQLVPLLEALGRRHRYVGVQPEHFGDLEAALLLTLGDLLGPALTAPARTAWAEFYAEMSRPMLRGLAAVAEAADTCDTTRFFRPPS